MSNEYISDATKNLKLLKEKSVGKSVSAEETLQFIQAQASIAVAVELNRLNNNFEDQMKKGLDELRKDIMRNPETDAVPRPTSELLEKAIDAYTKGQINLQFASYQETRNGRVEKGMALAAQFGIIRQAVQKIKEIKG